MQVLSVNIDSISVGERHRAFSEDAVTRLAESIKAIGLRQPISIRIDSDGVTSLVAGRHRLEAMKRLGNSDIACIEVAGDELNAELWEIAENLHRFDLTKEQRDQHIRRYAEVLAEIETQQSAVEIQTGQTVHPEIGYKKPPPQTPGMASKIAKATGLSAKTVKRALSPRPKPAPRPQLSPAGKQLAKLRQAWREASPAVRQHFLTEITEREAA